MFFVSASFMFIKSPATQVLIPSAGIVFLKRKIYHRRSAKDKVPSNFSITKTLLATVSRNMIVRWQQPPLMWALIHGRHVGVFIPACGQISLIKEYFVSTLSL